MSDPDEVRNAHSRSVDGSYTEYFYREHCHVCKAPYDAESGYETTIYDGIASYTMWYCKECESSKR